MNFCHCKINRQEKFQEALADFNKAIELDKNFAIAYANRGHTLQAIGNLADAEKDFGKAISLDPSAPLFCSLRGTCRLSQGNTAGAMEDYAQAIRLSPQFPVPLADLGFAKFFAKDYAGAYESFDQATQLDPKTMRYLNPWKLWSLAQSGKPDAAAEIAVPVASKPEKERDWIDALVLYLGGKISEKDLVNMVSATTDEKMKSAQLCEAYFFIAERRTKAKDKDAQAFYKLALQTKANYLSAYRGAQFALQSFGK